MPRPKKKTDLIARVLEGAHGNLSVMLEIVEPVSRMRLTQAIRRHPDLKDLLEPLLDEMQELHRSALVARTEVRTAIKMVWKE